MDHPVFTATVAKDVQKHFVQEYNEFHLLNEKFRAINKTEIIKKISNSISDFFGLFRNKINELQIKAVSQINNSNNLTELMECVDSLHKYLDKERIIDKYDSHKEELTNKIDNLRYTFICQKREEFDTVTEELKEDNLRMIK